MFKFAAAAGAAFAAFAFVTPSAAQIAVEANVARVEDDWGGELGAGYTLVQIGGFRLTPGAGVFIYDRGDGTFSTTGGDGSGRCFDRRSGLIVPEGLCDTGSVNIYARAEATYSLPLGFTVGAGARFMRDDLRPYATASYPVLPLLNLKGNLGPEYLALGVQARF